MGYGTLPDLRGKRAVSLLRVSDIRQASRKVASGQESKNGQDSQNGQEPDIPDQRTLVDSLITETGMTHVKELLETGISGWKVKMKNRDKVQIVKAMADRKEFDVLVVYLSDRIGRTSDESPLVVSYLNQAGILVITYVEGIISTETQNDKLITFIKFWSHENESVKKSFTSTDYQTSLIKAGKYRGGSVKTLPYGYRRLHKGTRNAKGREIYDIEIDPEQSKIVSLIYDLSLNYNWGGYLISAYLTNNAYYKSMSKSGDGWAPSTIDHILANPIYKGIVRMHSKVKEEDIVCDNAQEHLIIIPPDVWDRNRKVVKNRTTEKKLKYANNSNNREPNSSITASRELLSGLVHCGHCGAKMSTWANYKHYEKRMAHVQIT